MKNGEFISSRWRRSCQRRLRTCNICRRDFPSGGAENQMCPECIKRQAEARARPYTGNTEEMEVIDDLFDTFDTEMLERRKRAQQHDSERRILRQQRIERYRKLRYRPEPEDEP